MKSIIIYSSLTGNTKMVAEAMLAALPPETLCCPVKSAPAPDNFDLLILGFWVDKGQADQLTLDYLNKIENKKVAFFFTLGAYPDSDHANEVAAATEKILQKGQNNILGHFRCQGKVDPGLIERMNKMLPPDHPHGQMSPERRARLEEAAKHPDKNDLINAGQFVQTMLSKM